MMYLLNILDDIANSNALFSMLVVMLIIVSLITFYLMYTQNKEITKQINTARLDKEIKNEMNKEKKQVSFMEEIVQNDVEKTDLVKPEVKPEVITQEVKIEEQPLNLDSLNNELVENNDDSLLFESVPSFDDDLDLYLLNNNEIKRDTSFGEVKSVLTTDEEPVQDNMEEYKEEIHIDPENINVPEEELDLELKAEPEIEENNSEFDLSNVTKELESVAREKTIELTPYEAMQEENAIISYDELIRQADLIKSKYAPSNRGPISYDSAKDLSEYPEEQSIPDVSSYEHEEAFLEALKQLQQILN